jgi:hypothetical protein
MYLENVGIRSIERLEEVSGALIVYWIRHFSRLIRKEMSKKALPDKVEEIAIIEVDELFLPIIKKDQTSLCMACC